MNINTKLNLVLAMQVFARVVEAGTFTRAADSLKMPKATVTKLVQGLENHLRVRLLNRTTRRVTVTPDGSAYYERAVRLLETSKTSSPAFRTRRRTRREGCASTSAAHSRVCSSFRGCRISSSDIRRSRWSWV